MGRLHKFKTCLLADIWTLAKVDVTKQRCKIWDLKFKYIRIIFISKLAFANQTHGFSWMLSEHGSQTSGSARPPCVDMCGRLLQLGYSHSATPVQNCRKPSRIDVRSRQSVRHATVQGVEQIIKVSGVNSNVILNRARSSWVMLGILLLSKKWLTPPTCIACRCFFDGLRQTRSQGDVGWEWVDA